MIPPKYNFYIGAANVNIYISSGTGISNSGEFISESDKYSCGLSSLNENKQIFFNLVSVNSYNAIFFYDSSRNFISYKTLMDNNNTVIAPPSNAKYFAVRFTSADANFMAKKDTNFVYFIKSVNPHYKELNKKYAKESGQEFFRISLDGKINLFGNDYEIVRNSSLEDQMIFIIDKYNRTSGKWIEYYKGEFSKTDCKLDYEKKSCELKTTALDEYNDVINKYENTYDLVKLAPAISRINLHKRSLMQVYIRGANSISNFFGGIYWESDVNEVIDNHTDLVNKYYFAYVKSGNEFYIRNAGISGVNGVYAGTNGYWSKWDPGHTCKMELVDGSSTMYWVRLYRNSDNTLLYQSEIQWAVTDPNDKFIGRHNVKMVNVNNSSDTFIIESPFVYQIYRRLLCDVDTVSDSEGVKNTYNLPSDDFVTDNRNYKKCIGLTGGMFFCTSRAVDEPTRYGLNDYNQYFTNEFIPYTGRPLPISRNSWANASLWYVYDNYYSLFEQRLRKQYTLKDSYSIAATIKALLKRIDPTLQHEATAEYSRFLYDTNMPVSMARFYVHITQKTNILKGEYDQPAQKAEVSLEDIMKMLRDCFRCYWYIEDNKFKIEHISFFMRGGSYYHNTSIQLDFTKLVDRFNKKLSSYFQSEVEYDKTDLNQRYEFGWMDDVTDLFGGVTIDVKSNYVQKDKTEEINISQFSSDVDYMLFNPSNFSDDGFALLCPTLKKISAWGSYKRRVYKGESFIVRTVGGTDSRAYALTDLSRKILSVADANLDTTSNPISVNVEEDGYLYINCTPSNNVNFALSQSFYTYDNSILEGGTYYNLSGGVGSIAPENPSEFAYTDEYNLPIIETQLVDENGDTYNAIIQNFYASWAYLVRFYMYDMPATNIECNILDNLYPFDTKMCMKHTIEFPIEEDLDELELIKTTIGNGKIDEVSININTRHAKVRLLYGPQ